MIDLVLQNRTKNRAYGRVFFVRVFGAVAPYLKLPKGHRAEVGVVLVGPGAMRTLNRTRRNVDKVTDVLSFPLHMEPISGYTAVLLGDLFICPDAVRSHAAESGRSVRSQMAWTAIHGLLHLAGYDHERGAADARKMFSLEQKILTKLGL
jgi:probable rRNA maturation factor